MACIELVNSSALTLEGGPLTVTEGDLYVGEAMLDTMKPGDRRFVPFAVELGCVVSVDDTTDSGSVYKAVVAHGSLSAEYWQYRRTKLAIRNKGKKPQTLWIEHPKSEGWELDLPDDERASKAKGDATPKPAETTDRYDRFKVELTPGKDAEIRISERAKGWHTWSLDSADDDTLKYWLESKYVDKRLVEAMREVITLKAKIEALESKKEKLDEEREKLFEDQERLRENVGAMKGGGASQKEAAEKWVKKLAAQEDRLEKIESESEKLDKEIEKLQEETDERIQKIAFTADLGEKK
jgi:outer membrane murein-binding lipoprotein Lpp